MTVRNLGEMKYMVPATGEYVTDFWSNMHVVDLSEFQRKIYRS